MYGTHGTQLRTAMTKLLHEHRIQQRLGGPGGPFAPAASTTPAQRAELGVHIRRYRQTVLAWCAEATRAAQPVAFSNVPRRGVDPFRESRDGHIALNELRRSLQRAQVGSDVALPDLEELTTPHPNATVETWRQAAKAAALAEHDLGGAGMAGQLSVPQAQALIGDVAAIAQALVILDRRYRVLPGWQRLARCDRLGWAALACALDVGLGRPDYSVDETGWRPRLNTIPGPAKPGVPGVLQAQHNLLVRLAPFPNLANLTIVVEGQQRLSAELAERVAPLDPPYAERWSRRAETYAHLHANLQGLAGRIGKGSFAAAEAANALTRLRAIPRNRVLEPRLLAGFEVLFAHVDDRIADILQEAIRRGAYLQRVTMPRLDADSARLVQPVRERVTPLTGAPRVALARLAETRLRPPPRAPKDAPERRRSRVHLATALLHRPASEGLAGPAPS